MSLRAPAASAALGLACLLLAGACGGGESQPPPPQLDAARGVRKAFVARMATFDAPIQGYRMETGHVPEGEDASALREAGISNFPAEDPWGGEVRYSGSGTEYTIRSAGPDKAWGTGDDITLTNGREAP